MLFCGLEVLGMVHFGSHGGHFLGLRIAYDGALAVWLAWTGDGWPSVWVCVGPVLVLPAGGHPRCC